MSIRRRLLWSVVLLPGIFYAGALVFLKASESELVFRASVSHGASNLQTFSQPFATDVKIPLDGGETLAGFALAPDPASDRGFWILHLHGNADSAFSPGQFQHVVALREQGFHVLAMDYRGFGSSPDRPSEEHVYEDAEAAFRWLIKQGVPEGRIILWGHSLGSGPAVWLATRHRVASLVLFGAFTSVPDRAAELYPWLPVRWVAGIRFNNLQRLPQVHVPVLIVHAVTDQTIPLLHAERLFAVANEPKRLLKLEAKSDDGFGGHYAAAYEQLDVLIPALLEMMRANEEAVGPPGTVLQATIHAHLLSSLRPFVDRASRDQLPPSGS